MTSAFFLDRAQGALLGLAIGDALGTTLEFSARDSHSPVTDLVGGGPFALPAGAWTDDTSMALCLAESLNYRKRFDAVDCMNRFVNWWRHGYMSATGECFDIGVTTEEALARYERSGDPYAGSTDPKSAGNGSLMRLAPVVIAARQDRERAIRDAGEQSRLTHGAVEAVSACRHFALLLHEAMTGASKDEVLAPRTLTEGVPAKIRRLAATDWRPIERAAISSSGYVVDTLEAALWAVSTTTSFEEAVILAVNLGGDADTVGAVTGQLAGAIHGRSAIPPAWQDKLVWGDWIAELAGELCAS
ncbi:ADP-ribosylglycohydrolase [Labrys miyagiensis]|uniref:ADP-ribosylglycohydrolase n=1 Tax=Labrys miyagiensis TaxID=346912 RepID=A0ABQ6CR51_9HYPH|nr:ADP-ribosylglycohydrolase family protein [Labrys miyagiensis]GLS22818.1 ADP-ribosylglycohydrolase [Labrys miyagiensis]